ncbi:MAG: Na/Pi cotransporter family protein [Candidatus Marinimicrobia bacterium]|jgi:phosphate:Na+ symporter|nr:Na/Pi cotransporter family protein [Candidatus Neomarinimicrobiota bacterium]MBT3574827.1 Na/Pi cotransporter family protein [Candidatus Neomarinimicrobiota bacterium]MBT3679823.1 Na/Pi cotransporter family protein [Candidatus Neomarinimicrobiota bacterium]MBT3951014.1 Na/Pi cotransporter family protein [Candidatus Neomarinimicrobiota bacterium]MBT4252484.1 Na/Pi cotransporter family protein [Candidatus Neomarinimicrobiota bacterium]
MKIFRFILVLSLASNQVFAASTSTNGSISWWALIMTLFGGLALFLYGMEKMSSGMKKAAGDKMRSILSALTNNRYMGLMVGAFVTMVIQSSSATTVMLVSFVQAGLMTFVQSLGVILGADIGTTVTAQLVAFKLTDYALLMIAIGFGLMMFGRNENQKNIGESVLGFGILFYGMKLMSDAMYPLRTYDPFITTLAHLENPLLGLLVGAAFTALIQSSSAFTGIVIVLAQQGLLTLDAGIPLIMGANIGTCITAGLASIGASREAKRVAMAHVMFKIVGVMLFIFWIPWFADIIRAISPASTETGMANLSAVVPRQIANAHTIFNVGLALAFIPFTSFFARLIMKIYPDVEDEKDLTIATWHLDESAVETPALALDLARSEIARMAKITGRMMDGFIHPFLEDDPGADKVHPQLTIMEGIEIREKKLDFLEKKIKKYLLQIGQEELSDTQIAEVFGMITISSQMESIGDVMERNLRPLVTKKRALQLDFSEEGKKELIKYNTKVCKQFSRLEKTFSALDPKRAKKVMVKEEKYLNLEAQYRESHFQRLNAAREETVETDAIHTELLEMMKQINLHTGEIAKIIYDLGSNEENEGNVE